MSPYGRLCQTCPIIELKVVSLSFACFLLSSVFPCQWKLSCDSIRFGSVLYFLQYTMSLANISLVAYGYWGLFCIELYLYARSRWVCVPVYCTSLPINSSFISNANYEYCTSSCVQACIGECGVKNNCYLSASRKQKKMYLNNLTLKPKQRDCLLGVSDWWFASPPPPFF